MMNAYNFEHHRRKPRLTSPRNHQKERFYQNRENQEENAIENLKLEATSNYGDEYENLKHETTSNYGDEMEDISSQEVENLSKN